MADCMTFPDDIMQFIDDYSFRDEEQVYTNGSELIQTFRVKQAIEHYLLAPEARVLTFDEVMALPHGEEDNAPVVQETRVPVETWDGGAICQWRGARFVQEMHDGHQYYNKDTYGRVWRCWTALPTIKQRKAVKWE